MAILCIWLPSTVVEGITRTLRLQRVPRVNVDILYRGLRASLSTCVSYSFAMTSFATAAANRERDAAKDAPEGDFSSK